MRHTGTTALAAASLLVALAACGSTSTPTPTNDVRLVTSSSVSLAISGPDATSHNANGSPAIEAECTDKQVDSRGIGTYDCAITWADGTHSKGVATVDNTGHVHGVTN